jgi:AraC-like DNA-binding protein
MADRVPIPMVLFEHLAQTGLDVELVLRLAKLPRSRFNVARPEGTTAEFFALWRAVEQTAADPGLGLQLGHAALTDEENVASLAALHSNTLGEGLERLARYKRLVCPEKVWLDIAQGEARLRFQWLLANEEPPALLTDLIFAGIVKVAQQGTNTPIKPRRIELTRAPAHEIMLQQHFGCEICFDAPHDVMVFDEAALALPMVKRNAQFLAILLPGLDLALSNNDASRTLVDDVRDALVEAMAGERPAISKIAKSLGMSVRTLQRRLGELGTTHQDLLDEVRHQSARRLLKATSLGIGEVAFLLGFEEVNSFARAFHLWEGVTPAGWRANTAS